MKTNFSPDNLESDLCWHTFSLPSSCQGETLFCRLAEPTTPFRAVVQISHGMCEHIDRYLPFFRFLAREGFVICGHDHLGTRQKLPGPFPSGIHLLRKRLSLSGGGPARRLPSPEKALSRSAAVLFGHSMGSMIARLYLSQIRFPLAGRGAVRHRRTQSRLARRAWRCAGTSSPPRARCTAPLAFIR